MDRQALVNTDGRSEFGGKALKADDRPFDYTPVSLDQLPNTPTRDRNIAASAWTDAPAALLGLGRGLDQEPEAAFKRRLHGWLLWRAGPTRGPCRYLALDPHQIDEPSATWTFVLDGAGGAHGVGPDGQTHDRFRSWKESLRDNPV
ncbi:MAG: hypothetical protein ACKVHU_06570 [Acidimicrobiales bacterium]|jgi:hypothetical protein